MDATVLGIEVDGRVYVAGVVAGHPTVYPTGRDGNAVPFVVMVRGSSDLGSILTSFRNVYAEWTRIDGPIGSQGLVSGVTIGPNVTETIETANKETSAAQTVTRRWYNPRTW